MRALKAAVLAATTALTACVTPYSGNDGMYALPIGDAPVTSNPTAYTPALNCLADYARQNQSVAPRIAVGRILDYTGSVSEEGGRRITQGASLMAMSAFNKAGARLVERFDTSVTELELRYANNRLIGQEGAGASDENVRRIYAGQMPGSDYYFVGGITELNYNIRSMGVDAQGGHTDARDGVGNLGARLYVMNIALDFRVIDTRTLEVVDVISYQKQIIGREVRAGVFSFFDDTLIDIAAGERALEPVQLAVRAGVERAVVEVMSGFYGVNDSSACQGELSAEGDPMGPGDAPARREAAQAATRAETNAWHANRDENITDLRGRS
jgi:curli biogenesis system outer membrane secretion channel CsgG